MSNLRIVKVIFFFVTAVLTFLSAACLREKNWNCSEGVVLKFKYLNQAGENRRSGITSTVHLSVFIFDGKGLYVGEKNDFMARIDDNYSLQLPFYRGQYQFVVWVGLSGSYRLFPCVIGQTDIRDFTLQLKRDSSRSNFFSPELLYHGRQDPVTLDPSRTEVVTIGLLRMTNTIRVIIHSADPIRPSRISIEDNNGLYDFRGEKLPDEWQSYVPSDIHGTEEPGTWVADFNVMRLQQNSEALLKINNSSGSLQYNEKLVSGLLENNPGINFDVDHDFTIEITFDAYYVPVSILINGWEIIPENIG